MAEVDWSMLGDLGNSFIAGQAAGQKAKSDAAWNAIADNFVSGGGAPGAPVPGTTTLGQIGAPPAMAAGAAAPAMKMPSDPAIEQRFAQTLKAGGLTNPYGLSAMMSHANAESGFSPSNFAGSWSDPSQSGQAGTSGGALSWRDGGGGTRFSDMRAATAGAADPVVAQAKYALVERPNVTLALQNAKSADEANAILAKSQAFAGYNDPNNAEYQRRLAGTTSYMGRLSSLFGGDGSVAPAGAPARSLFAAAPAAMPARVAAAAPVPAVAPVVPASAPMTAPAQSGLTADLPGNDGPQATGSTAAAAPVAPSLDKGSLFRLSNGAKVDPNAPATSFVGASTIVANRDLFIGPDGRAKPVGQVMASLNPSGTVASDASPGPVPASAAAPAVVASLAPAGAPAAPAGAAPAAAGSTANPGAKIDMTGDFPVMVKGKLWTAAAAAKTDPEDTSTPDADDVRDAQFAARKQAGLDPKTGMAADAAAPAAGAAVVAQAQDNARTAAQATVAASAASGGPTLPASLSPGAPLPAAANRADNSQVRMMIGAMLKDPSTRGAGIQAMMALQTKQAASPPFMFNGNLMQYGADGSLHQVLAGKESYTQEKDADGNIWNVNSNGQKIIALSAKDKADEGAKNKALVAQREDDVKARGQDPTDPDVRQFIQTGHYPGGENDLRVLRQGDKLINRKGATVAENASSGGGNMPDATADFLAERVLAGDKGALVGLGRGAQGAENLAKIQGLVGAKAKDRGMDASDLLANAAKVAGMTAEQRTFGAQNARMSQASTEAEGAIDLARQASDKVFRSSYVPYNKLSQMISAGTSDPDLKSLNTTIQGVINTYARAINPNGAPTVESRNHAREILSAADGPEAFNAALDQMGQEIKIAHESPAKAAQMLENIRKARKNGVLPPMAQGGSGPDMAGASPTSNGTVPWSPPIGETVPDRSTGSTGGNDGAGVPAPAGQRIPLPSDYNASKAISDARAALAAHPEARAGIIAKLNGYGIPGSVLGN